MHVAKTFLAPAEKISYKDPEEEEGGSLVATVHDIPLAEPDKTRREDQMLGHDGQKDTKLILLSAIAQTEHLSNIFSQAMSRNGTESENQHMDIVPITMSINQHLTDLLELNLKRDEETLQLRKQIKDREGQIENLSLLIKSNEKQLEGFPLNCENLSTLTNSNKQTKCAKDPFPRPNPSFMSDE